MNEENNLSIDYDKEKDIVMICGIKYSGHLFRSFGYAKPGKWLRIKYRKDGVLHIDCVSEATEKTFDILSGRGFDDLKSIK